MHKGGGGNCGGGGNRFFCGDHIVFCGVAHLRLGWWVGGHVCVLMDIQHRANVPEQTPMCVLLCRFLLHTFNHLGCRVRMQCAMTPGFAVEHALVCLHFCLWAEHMRICIAMITNTYVGSSL